MKSKVIFKSFCFEITRKCNMKCLHCMRGEAQDLTISKQVIDECLDNIAGMYDFILTGGESFLEPDMIEYLFDEIIRREITVYGFSCVTNGSVRSEKVAKAWNRLADYIAARYKLTEDAEGDRKYLRSIGRITVSYDKYHQLEYDAVETVKWYRQYLNNHCIALRENLEENETIHALGRVLENDDIMRSGKIDYVVCPHRISLLKDTNMVETGVQVGCNGIITCAKDSSFEQQDKKNFGNILTEPLFDIMQRGMRAEPFTEKEAAVYDRVYTELRTGKIDLKQGNELLTYFDSVYTARKVCQKIYPWMTFEEMVEAVYDDMNIQLRKTEDSPYIFTIYPLEEYKVTREESIKRTQTTKIKALLTDPLSYFSNLSSLKASIEETPLKIWDGFKRCE